MTLHSITDFGGTEEIFASPINKHLQRADLKSVRRTRAFISFVLLLLKNLEYVHFFCVLKSLHRKNGFAEVSKNLARSEIILLDKIIM